MLATLLGSQVLRLLGSQVLRLLGSTPGQHCRIDQPGAGEYSWGPHLDLPALLLLRQAMSR